MARQKALSAVAVFAVTSTFLIRLPAAEMTREKFKQLHAQLEPSVDEPWRTIPWKIGLLDAQQAAAKQQKPIFIWAMDGHPLGCT